MNKSVNKITNADENKEEKKLLYAVGGNVILGEIGKTTISSSNPTFTYIFQRKWMLSAYQRHIWMPTFVVILFANAKI